MASATLPGPQALQGAPPRVYFSCHRDAIEGYLRLGYHIKEIWRAYLGVSPPYPGCYTSFYRQVRKHGLGSNEPGGAPRALTNRDVSDRPRPTSTASTASIEYVRNNLRRNLPKLELE
jgi:hypothetical protein